MNAREVAAYIIQVAYRKRQGTEVFSDKGDGFALTVPKIANMSVKTKVDGPVDMSIFDERKHGDNFSVEEIEGRSGIRGSIRVQRGQRRHVGNFDSVVSVVKINLKMILPAQKASVQIFKKQGYIIINTNGPWERVARILAKTYFPGKFGMMIENGTVNSVLEKFFCNRHIDTKLLTKLVDKSLGPQIHKGFFGIAPPANSHDWALAGGLGAFSHQETFPHLLPEEVARLPKIKVVREVAVVQHLQAGGGGVILSIFPSGSIVSSSRFESRGPVWFKQLVSDFKGVFLKDEKRSVGAKVTRKEEKRAAITQNRNPAAPSWNAVHPNQSVKTFVRPGPDGKPRYYLFTSAELQRAKAIRAFLDAGVNIPQRTREMLEITPAHIAEVKAAMGAPAVKGPSGWNNQSRQGYYVRPNSQGKPRWYEIPTGLASGKKTLLKSYGKFQITPPQWLRNHFKISNAEVQAAVANHHVNYGLNKKLRINGKNATRFNKETLLNTAHNMGVKHVTERMNKMEIASAIAGRMAPGRQRIDLTLNGVHHTFLANGSVRRNYKNKASRTRQFATLKADERDAIAKAFLPANKYESFRIASPSNKYKILMNHKAAKATVAPPTAKGESPKSPENVWGNLESEMDLTLGYLNINRSNLPELMTRLRAIEVGVRGKPPRAKVDATLAKFIKEKKTQRNVSEKRAAYRNKIVIPKYVPANRVNEYKNFVANFATTKGKRGFPTKKRVAEVAKNWIRVHAPQRPAQPARTVENVVTGAMRFQPAYVPSPRASPNVPTPPIKKPKTPPVVKSPSKTRRVIPMNERFELMVNNMNRMGHAYKPEKVYSWEDLAKLGVSNKYRSNWLEYVKSVKRT